jgi:hypothetical protein
MKTFFLLLVVVGLLTGPGYWIVARFYSGSAVANLALQGDAAGVLWSPDFALSADMDPVALVLVAHGDFAPNMEASRAPRERYRVDLQHDGTTVQMAEFELAAPAVAVSEPVFRERVLLLGEVDDGTFRVCIEPLGERRMTLAQARLDVRRNVQAADGRVLLVGALLTGLGILGLLLAPRLAAAPS